MRQTYFTDGDWTTGNFIVSWGDVQYLCFATCYFDSWLCFLSNTWHWVFDGPEILKELVLTLPFWTPLPIKNRGSYSTHHRLRIFIPYQPCASDLLTPSNFQVLWLRSSLKDYIYIFPSWGRINTSLAERKWIAPFMLQAEWKCKWVGNKACMFWKHRN